MTRWDLPPRSLLTPGDALLPEETRDDVVRRALGAAGVDVESVDARVGPQAVRYGIRLAPGVPPKKVEAATDSVALALGREVRYGGIYGSTVALEATRKERDTVALRDLLDKCEAFVGLGFPVGVTLNGTPVQARLSSLPHLLIAGTTGSGKSVAMNAILTSLLLRNTPADMELVMIDVKRVELSAYAGLPHLRGPIVTDPADAIDALRALANEMDRRYGLFEDARVKDLNGYNDVAAHPLGRIVLVVDELGDLTETAPKAVGALFERLGRLARAAGIHMLLATQRPSVKTVSGEIKANVNARLVFAVSSSQDSVVALGSSGAQRLGGQGDGLWRDPASTKPPVRIQAPYVTESDVERVVKFWAAQRPVPVAEPARQASRPASADEEAIRAEVDALPLPWERTPTPGIDTDTSLSPFDVLAEAGLDEVAVEAIVRIVLERLGDDIADKLLVKMRDLE